MPARMDGMFVFLVCKLYANTLYTVIPKNKGKCVSFRKGVHFLFLFKCHTIFHFYTQFTLSLYVATKHLHNKKSIVFLSKFVKYT